MSNYLQESYDEALKENCELREKLLKALKTLEWYGDIENHQPKSSERFWDNNLYEDRGKQARAILMELNV